VDLVSLALPVSNEEVNSVCSNRGKGGNALRHKHLHLDSVDPISVNER